MSSCEPPKNQYSRYVASLTGAPRIYVFILQIYLSQISRSLISYFQDPALPFDDIGLLLQQSLSWYFPSGFRITFAFGLHRNNAFVFFSQPAFPVIP
jgi:hypothetical protein